MAQTRIHPDEQLTTGIKGDLLARNASGEWKDLGVGADGDVLTADSSAALGVSYQTPTPIPSGWLLVGNAGTIPATNYIGTSDATDFHIKLNGTTGGQTLKINDAATAGGSIHIGYNNGGTTDFRYTEGQTSGDQFIDFGKDYSGGGIQTFNIFHFTSNAATQNINIGVVATGGSQGLSIGAAGSTQFGIGYLDTYAGDGLYFNNGTNQFRIHMRSAPPEGVQTGTPGDLFIHNGLFGAELYQKLAGAGTVNWGRFARFYYASIAFTAGVPVVVTHNLRMNAGVPQINVVDSATGNKAVFTETAYGANTVTITTTTTITGHVTIVG